MRLCFVIRTSLSGRTCQRVDFLREGELVAEIGDRAIFVAPASASCQRHRAVLDQLRQPLAVNPILVANGDGGEQDLKLGQQSFTYVNFCTMLQHSGSRDNIGSRVLFTEIPASGQCPFNPSTVFEL